MSRIFMDFNETKEELTRDLAEMGIRVHPKTVQDKNVENDPDYETRELQNYSYTILDAKSEDVKPYTTQPWADDEFKERVFDPFTNSEEGEFINPGEAWLERKDVWEEYMHEGKFAYTYNARIWRNNQLNKIINRLKEDPESRQLWLNIWDPNEDVDKLGGVSRVPCSLGYNFQFRDGKLNMHYIMRSQDFGTHYYNDVYLAIKLLEYVAEKVNLPVGNFSHTVFSLHIFAKDVKGVF